jgi:hypothetical protein
MDKISCIDRVRNEVLHRDNEDRNIVHTTRRKTNWIGLILRTNCLLKHGTEDNYRGKDTSDVKTKKGT